MSQQAYILQDWTKALVLQFELYGTPLSWPAFTQPVGILEDINNTTVATVNVVVPNPSDPNLSSFYVAAFVSQDLVDGNGQSIWYNEDVYVDTTTLPAGVSASFVNVSSLLSAYDGFSTPYTPAYTGQWGLYPDPDGVSAWAASTFVYPSGAFQKYNLSTMGLTTSWMFPWGTSGGPTPISGGSAAAAWFDTSGNVYAMSGYVPGSNYLPVNRIHKVSTSSFLELGALGYDGQNPPPLPPPFADTVYIPQDWCYFSSGGNSYVSLSTSEAGAWSPLVSYAVGNQVTYDSYNWVAVLPSANQQPNFSSIYWSPTNQSPSQPGFGTVVNLSSMSLVGSYNFSYPLVVQTASVSSPPAVGSLQVTFSANVSVGDILLLETGLISPNTTSSVTDNLGNTWALIAEIQTPSPNPVERSVWWAQVSTGGSCTVTANFTSSTSAVLYAAEIAGLGSVMATPVYGTGTTSGSSFAAGPITTSSTLSTIFLMAESHDGTHTPNGYAAMPFPNNVTGDLFYATATVPPGSYSAEVQIVGSAQPYGYIMFAFESTHPSTITSPTSTFVASCGDVWWACVAPPGYAPTGGTPVLQQTQSGDANTPLALTTTAGNSLVVVVSGTTPYNGIDFNTNPVPTGITDSVGDSFGNVATAAGNVPAYGAYQYAYVANNITGGSTTVNVSWSSAQSSGYSWIVVMEYTPDPLNPGASLQLDPNSVGGRGQSITSSPGFMDSGLLNATATVAELAFVTCSFSVLDGIHSFAPWSPPTLYAAETDYPFTILASTNGVAAPSDITACITGYTMNPGDNPAGGITVQMTGSFDGLATGTAMGFALFPAGVQDTHLYLFKWHPADGTSGLCNGTLDPRLNANIIWSVPGASWQSGTPGQGNPAYARYVPSLNAVLVGNGGLSTGTNHGDVALISLATGNQIAFVPGSTPPYIFDVSNEDAAYSAFRDQKTPGLSANTSLALEGDPTSSSTQQGGLAVTINPATLAVQNTYNLTTLASSTIGTQIYGGGYTYMGNWLSTVNYAVADIVTGSDGGLYVALTTSGPSDSQGNGVQDPASNGDPSTFLYWSELPSFTQELNSNPSPAYPYLANLLYNQTQGTVVSTSFPGSVLLSYKFGAAAVSTTTTVAATPSTVSYGNPVTITATVAQSSGPNVPTGTVQFMDGANSLGTPQALNGAGVATLVWTYDGTDATYSFVGAHSLTATYIPSGSFTATPSNTFTETVNPYATGGLLVSSEAPSAFEDEVTFTVTVSNLSAISAVAPTGTVNFSADGNPPFGTPTLTPLSASVSAVSATATVATYVGSNSFSLGQTVTITGFNSPYTQFNQTQVVVASANPNQFTVGGAYTPVSQVDQDGSAVSVSASTAQASTTELAVGLHAVAASYLGDAVHAADTSNTVVQQVVAVVATTIQTLPGFALIASYSTSGDSLLPPQAQLFAVPSSVTAHEPVNLLWSTLNVSFVGITGNNGTDYLTPPPPGSASGFNTGLISTGGSGIYVVGNGFTESIELTLQAYDVNRNPIPGLVSQVQITVG